MRFEANQNMRLGQQMKLSPRVIQSMEILQMPVLALQERIEQELESNVALEQVEPGQALDQETPESSVEQRELVVGDSAASDKDDWERLSDMESTYKEAFENEYSSQQYSPSRMAGERDRKMDAMANIVARSASLTEQLMAQWRLAEVPAKIAQAGELLIGAIDDDGLLSSSLEEILEQHRNVPGLDIDPDLIEEALGEIQHWLEPTGIGARDVREALLLQVDEREAAEGDEGWADVRLLINEHFDDLLENRLPKIVQQAEMTMERVTAAKQLMRLLSPSPARTLVTETAAPIFPDVIVEFDETSDSYVAALSDGFLPILKVSQRYANMSKDKAEEKTTREFAANSVRNATWLLEAVNQRRSTMLRVVNVVLARQREFLDHGPQHLKPLPMIEVADQLGVHVATVSRAVAEKWMATPRGLFPLRMFFSGGTETESGENMSWGAVRATLQEIVDEEDKHRPLSDEALSQALKERGIDIARRTVVKYRQQLGIPPARRRKEYGE